MVEEIFRAVRNLIRIYFVVLSRSSELQKFVAIGSTGLIIVGVGTFVAVHFHPDLAASIGFDQQSVGVLIAVGAMGVATVIIARSPSVLAAFSDAKAFGLSAADLELEPIRHERMVLEERLAQKDEPNIFDTIQLNLNQLNEYYTINKSQARRSFAASLFAIICGLLVIVFVVILPTEEGKEGMTRAYLGGIAGVILQFIGGAYFYLYNKSLSQLNFFFGRLSKTQDTMLAIKLCEGLGETPNRSDTLVGIISALLASDLTAEGHSSGSTHQRSRTGRTSQKSRTGDAPRRIGRRPAAGTQPPTPNAP